MTDPLTHDLPAPPKRSWPLVALGAAGFVPIFGFFLGAVAVTWALLSERPRRTLALGLVATGAFLNLSALFLIGLSHRHDRTVVSFHGQMAQRSLVEVVFALERYRAAHGNYPPSLQVLVGYPVPTSLLNINDRSDGSLIPHPYQYTVSADGQSYDLFAVGPDGRPGTADDITPPIPDSMRSQTGYVPAH